MSSTSTPPRGNRHSSTWTREIVMERIAQWAEEHGQPPTAAQWNPARARIMADKANAKARTWLDGIAAFEQGGWPSQDTVDRLFGGWSNAIEAAGFAKRPAGRTSIEFKRRHSYGAHVDAMTDLRFGFAAVERARTESAVEEAVRDLASIALAWLDHIEAKRQERSS
jgi:uncharacterized protein YgfB (UPF0149 family)